MVVRVNMAKLIKIAVVVALIIGAMIFLASRAGEKPLTPQEKAVSLDALPK